MVQRHGGWWAWAAMVSGVVFAILGFVCTQYWASWMYPLLSGKFPGFLEFFKVSLEGLGSILPFANWEVGPKRFPISGQEIYLLTMLTSISSYIGISLLTCREKFNLDKVLHSGEFRRRDDDAGSAPIGVEKKRSIIQKLLGFNEKYTRGDRILAWAVFYWTMGNFVIFLVTALWNIFFGVWSGEVWFLYWKYYSIGLTAVVAVVTTVWFTIGGTLDLRKLFESLKKLQVDAADDGRVIDHMNADDYIAEQATEAIKSTEISNADEKK